MRYISNRKIRTLIIALFILSKPLYARELVEFSVFEKVYLNEKREAIQAQKISNYELDRFNYKRTQIETKRSSKQEVDNYNFEISVSSNSEAEQNRYEISNQAYTFLIDGDYESAIFFYQKFIDNFGTDLDVLTAIGSAYQRLGDIETSKKYYSDVLNKDPGNEIALNNYIVLIGEDKPDEGIQTLRRINELHNNKIIAAQLGYLYALKKDYAKAKDAFEEAFRTDNTDVKLSYNLALSYDLLGNTRSAYLLYQQILYNAKYRNHQFLIPRDSIQKRYKVLEQVMQDSNKVI
jgi:tetratricopeptide (TPR) repeat protein